MDLVYDPSLISYETLLDQFWTGYVPTRARSSQYRAAIFCHDEAQFALAKSRVEKEGGRPGSGPEVVLGKTFYAAEDYHQKWRLRRKEEFFDDLQKNYESEADLLASTAATKLNGYVGGFGTALQVERDAKRLGLSEMGIERLISLVNNRRP